jgi:hypothetical protein
MTALPLWVYVESSIADDPLEAIKRVNEKRNWRVLTPRRSLASQSVREAVRGRSDSRSISSVLTRMSNAQVGRNCIQFGLAVNQNLMAEVRIC